MAERFGVIACGAGLAERVRVVACGAGLVERFGVIACGATAGRTADLIARRHSRSQQLT